MMNMGKKPKHLDPAYETALIVCAMLNLVICSSKEAAACGSVQPPFLADAGDFLENATVLGLAFVAIGWSARARSTAGLVQGFAMTGIGIGSIVQIALRILEGGAPSPRLMSSVERLLWL